MQDSDAEQVQGWIKRQLRRKWPGAKVASHQERNGSYYFPVRHDGRDLWLVVELRAYRSLALDELKEFLNEESWLKRLRVEECVLVHLPGIHPALGRLVGSVGPSKS